MAQKPAPTSPNKSGGSGSGAKSGAPAKGGGGKGAVSGKPGNKSK